MHPDTGLMATLSFIRPQETKPEFQSAALTGGAPKLFFNMERHTVTIAEMRDMADMLSIDREGFRLLSYAAAIDDLYDNAAIKQVYYPEIQALLRRELGASRVAIFDVTRRSDSTAGAPNPDGRRGDGPSRCRRGTHRPHRSTGSRETKLWSRRKSRTPTLRSSYQACAR